MPNRNLTAAELKRANDLLALVRSRLGELAGDDALLLFAYRRKIAKELMHDERSKPTQRRKLKLLKWKSQGQRCAHCGDEMPLKYSELDRKRAVDGYTEANTELLHAKCHHARQAAKGYT
jgi:hypothetical protein